MLCEKCEKRFATVHLSGWKTTSHASREDFNHHYCEDCAAELEKSDPLLNPLLAAGPNAKRYKLRVMSVNPEAIVVRRIGTESENEMEDWIFTRSLFPPEDYRRVGMEFEVCCNEAELEWLKGKRKYPSQNE